MPIERNAPAVITQGNPKPLVAIPPITGPAIDPRLSPLFIMPVIMP